MRYLVTVEIDGSNPFGVARASEAPLRRGFLFSRWDRDRVLLAMQNKKIAEANVGKDLHCFWCGRHLASSRENDNPLRFTRDHFPARVNKKDFPHLPYGVVWACFECNNARGIDDTWLPFSLRSEEEREFLLAEGTAGVVELQSRSQQEGRQILKPDLYRFLQTLERSDGWFGRSEDDEPLGV